LLGGPRCRFVWDRQVISEIFHFGKWIFISTACTFLAAQADRLLVPKLAGLATLGVYNLAVQIAFAAEWVISIIAQRVIFPLYSRMYNNGDPLIQRPGNLTIPAFWRRKFRDFRDSKSLKAEAVRSPSQVAAPSPPIDLSTDSCQDEATPKTEPRLGAIFSTVHPWAIGFAAFLTAGILASGPTLIRCLFRPQYHEAGWMLQLLAIGSWIKMLQSFSGSLLLAIGNSRGLALGNAMKLLAIPLSLWAGYSVAGLQGLIIGFVATNLIQYAVTLWVLRDQKLPILAYDLCLTAVIVVAWLLASQAGSLFVAYPGKKWLQFLAEGFTVALVWLGVAALGYYWRRPQLTATAADARM
jgi:O-antigen/teichoic acid export membrane protein